MQKFRVSSSLPLKPGVGQCKAMHVIPTARKFLLATFYLFSPFTFMFSTTSSELPPPPPSCVSVPHTGSLSRGGDVAVYVFDIDQPSSPTLFFLYSILVSVSVSLALSTVFHSINSPETDETSFLAVM